MAYSSPTKRNVRVIEAPAYQMTQRSSRRPQHTFNLIWKPYQIQPFMIAPVLPGETLQNMMVQTQIWSDPLAVGMKNIGWWYQKDFFYVKHQDLAGWDTDTTGIAKELADMFVSNASLAGFQDADGNAWTYAYPGAVDFLLECTKRVVDEFYRDEGENWDDQLLDTVPLAKIRSRGQGDAFERLTLASAYVDRSEAIGTNWDDIPLSWQEWASLRDGGQIDMDYDDWMRTYGSTTRRVEEAVQLHRPEHIAHLREFSYPTNTVEPTTGNPATAIGWRIANRLDKRIAFREPGWVVGYCVVRPKVYLGNQQGAIAGAMQSRATWLPPILSSQEDGSHLLFDDAVGPLKAVMDAGNVDYWIDLKDLMNMGDQFINYATPASGFTGVPSVDLPAASGQRRYASATEIMALFADTTNGRLRADGVVSLSIQGRQQQPNKSLVLGSGGMV